MTGETLKAHDVADYLLSKVNLRIGDVMTPLAIQKLLYYAQGFHLAMHGGEALFPENVVAWTHGPVVIAVWSRFKKYEWRPIDPPDRYRADTIPPEQREILDAVYVNYGQFGAGKLESMTHEEPPWKNTPQNRVIPQTSLREYFSTLVEAARNGEEVPDRPPWPINSFRFQGRKAISASMAPYRERLRAAHAARAARVDA